MRAVIFVDELGDEFDINLVSEVDITTIMGQPQFLFQPEKYLLMFSYPGPTPDCLSIDAGFSVLGSAVFLSKILLNLRVTPLRLLTARL